MTGDMFLNTVITGIKINHSIIKIVPLWDRQASGWGASTNKAIITSAYIILLHDENIILTSLPPP